MTRNEDEPTLAYLNDIHPPQDKLQEKDAAL
jgi:hypothetical protein